MLKSDATMELAKALKNVQVKLKPAKKDSENPYFKSSYADLNSVWEACRQLLGENGLSVTQTMDVGEGHSLIVETILLHESGEWITSRLPMVLAKNDPQGIGSAITYARRYGLSAIIGICSEEDDDAEGATVRKPLAQPVKKTEPKPNELTPLKNMTKAYCKTLKWGAKKWEDYLKNNIRKTMDALTLEDWKLIESQLREMASLQKLDVESEPVTDKVES